MNYTDPTLWLFLIEPIIQPICLRPYLVSATIMFRQLRWLIFAFVLYKRDVYVGTFFAKHFAGCPKTKIFEFTQSMTLVLPLKNFSELATCNIDLNHKEFSA